MSAALSEREGTVMLRAQETDSQLSGLASALHELANDRWQLDLYCADGVPLELLDSWSLKALGRQLVWRQETLDNIDWVAASLAQLKPVRARRFIVHGRHDRSPMRKWRYAIEIDASEAFGTGHHATTISCLDAIDKCLKARPMRSGLDLGTGTGLLAIAATKMQAMRMVATDNDPVAVSVARANFRINKVSRCIDCFVAEGLSHHNFCRYRKYDLICANILANVLSELAPQISAHAAPGAHVILSGLLASQARAILARYVALKFALEWRIHDGGWTSLILRRRRPALASPRPGQAPGMLRRRCEALSPVLHRRRSW